MYGAHNLGNSGDDIRSAIKMVETVAKQLSAPWSDSDMDFFHKADKW